jgi:hypothetical protein
LKRKGANHREFNRGTQAAAGVEKIGQAFALAK